MKAITEYHEVEKIYLKKFGEHSLDYVHLFDPVNIHNYPEEVLRATDKLEEAISKGVPFDNTKPEVEVIY
ncbi:hypothetical protein JXA27_08655 [Aerococcaceae bacterium zg-B36]|uniref:hypothetical protein n=1 Tax=Aerococcaceae bacterium zg-252 TaxID=2796928 RepID=UPI001BD869C9|nr:hypothetical protein [Aerococcaceae bacterium zg-B36]